MKKSIKEFIVERLIAMGYARTIRNAMFGNKKPLDILSVCEFCLAMSLCKFDGEEFDRIGTGVINRLDSIEESSRRDIYENL